MKLADIKPYGLNAKKHPAKQIKQVADSIKEFGFNQPIVVDKNNVIIVGHGRYEAAKLLGLKDVPTITVDLSEEKAKAYRLADNKLNESEWDMGLALEDLKGLSSEMFDLTGFDKDLLIEPDEKDDEIPDNAPTSAKLGDIWALGKHRVMCGDSTDKASVEKLMDGKKADMVFTDPPYGMNLETDYSKRDGKGTTLMGMKSMQAKGTYNAFSKLQRGKYTAVIGDNEQYDPTHIFRDFGYCKEILLWGADYYAEYLPDKNEGSWIVWDKRAGIEHVKFTLSEFELCWSKQKHARTIARFQWFGVMGLSKEDTKKRIHPTQKPVTLLSWFLTNFSGEEHLIIDLFLGSGSTLIAAEKTGRICYGMELDPKYVDVILKRWEDYTGKVAVKQ
jgi:site-specific DNA-methyltransferase (adenine-specific)